MRVILDTNVLVSGLFFGGIPGEILAAWNVGRVSLVISAPILAEYRETGAELAARYSALEFESFAALLVLNSEVVDAPQYLNPQVCTDAADDKFLACAMVAGCKIVVSGDQRLLETSGWKEIEVLRPRAFVERFLRKP